jgi:hypothetical protein
VACCPLKGLRVLEESFDVVACEHGGGQGGKTECAEGATVIGLLQGRPNFSLCRVLGIRF